MKKLYFVLGYGDDKNAFLSLQENVLSLKNIFKRRSKKVDYLHRIINEINSLLQQKDCIYIDDYRLIENNHYLINTKLKEDNLDISIEAICFLNDKFAKCKSAYPTIYDSFDDVKIKSNGMEYLQDLLISPFQGYSFYLKNKKVLVNECNGYADYGTLAMINEKSKFRLASVTKQFIAYGIVKLIDDGKLTYDTKLFDIFNDLPLWTKNITVKMILNHTSGLPDYESAFPTDKQINDYDVLDFIRESEKGIFIPGSRYKYSNTGYVILGLILEKVAYLRLGLYMKENVFDKVKMNDSLINYQGETEIANRVYGYKIINNQMIKSDQSYASALIGDGGVYSNIVDLKKWIKYLRKNSSELDKMISNRVNIGDGIEYGYGMKVKKVIYDGKEMTLCYHRGSTIGTNTLLGFIREIDFEFIFLTNQNGINTDTLANKILDKFFTKK